MTEIIYPFRRRFRDLVHADYRIEQEIPGIPKAFNAVGQAVHVGAGLPKSKYLIAVASSVQSSLEKRADIGGVWAEGSVSDRPA